MDPRTSSRVLLWTLIVAFAAGLAVALATGPGSERVVTTGVGVLFMLAALAIIGSMIRFRPADGIQRAMRRRQVAFGLTLLVYGTAVLVPDGTINYTLWGAALVGMVLTSWMTFGAVRVSRA